MTNETIGISAEVAIARSFNIPINEDYATRAEQTIVDLLMENNNVLRIFEQEGIPTPISHIAEGQNPIDFMLQGNKSLSVKTNMRGLGKVAPQKIAQPTSETYFTYLERNYGNFCLQDLLAEERLEDTYENRSYIFKKISLNHTAIVIDMYWKNLFDCDYYLHFFNLVNHLNPLDNYLVLGKEQTSVWENNNFTFTQSLNTWNESNTIKYCEISMGEFQVHRNRNCFKFRFNMKGVKKLFDEGLI